MTRVLLLGTCGMETTEMTARTEKYAGWCFAVAVLWSGMGEWVVDVSVLGVGTSLVARKV